jgi:AraC family transcriptional regulator
MEWSERMNAAINYFEDNLADEIDFNAAAQKACCSPFYFQRMFLAIIGVTPSAYVRRRSLTIAARELTSTNAKVIDVSLKYGYNSPVSFARAFRNVHGITPQAGREPGVKLKSFPRISFNIVLNAGNDMDYRTIEQPTFDVIGRGRKFTTNLGENFIKIPHFWQEFIASTEFPALLKLAGGKPGTVTGSGSLGVMIPDEKNTWDPFLYAICIEKVGKTATDFEVYHIPAATWAVFDCTLPKIQDVTKLIFSEWFPSTGYELDAKPEIEVYFPEDSRTKEILCQIWIPIIIMRKS